MTILIHAQIKVWAETGSYDDRQTELKKGREQEPLIRNLVLQVLYITDTE